MNRRAAITVLRERDDVERLWKTPEYRAEYIEQLGAQVRFKDAPGGRGTEIHVDLGEPESGALAGAMDKLTGVAHLAKAKDDLRRFKQHVETGEIPRSDGAPEGERAERKLKQRPAQPLADAELEKVGLS